MYVRMLHGSVGLKVKACRAFDDDGIAAVSRRGDVEDHCATNVAGDDIFPRRSHIATVRTFMVIDVGHSRTVLGCVHLGDPARPESALCLTRVCHSYRGFSFMEAKHQKIRGSSAVVN